MNERAQMPKNERMDEHREAARAAILEYLRDSTTKEERKRVFKEALSEWLQARFAEFGWFSLKALSAVAFFVVIALWLHLNGWNKS